MRKTEKIGRRECVPICFNGLCRLAVKYQQTLCILVAAVDTMIVYKTFFFFSLQSNNYLFGMNKALSTSPKEKDDCVIVHCIVRCSSFCLSHSLTLFEKKNPFVFSTNKVSIRITQSRYIVLVYNVWMVKSLWKLLCNWLMDLMSFRNWIVACNPIKVKFHFF